MKKMRLGGHVFTKWQKQELDQGLPDYTQFQPCLQFVENIRICVCLGGRVCMRTRAKLYLLQSV